MAYICTRQNSCRDCEHYRYDADRERYACWAQYDLAHDSAESEEKGVQL